MELMEIENSLDGITKETIEQNWDHKNNIKFTIHGITQMWNDAMRRKKWLHHKRKLANPKAGGFFIRNVKNKVAVKMLTTNGTIGQELEKFMLLDAPRAQDLGICDLFVLVVPADDVLEIYPASDENPFVFTESNCRAQLEEMFLINNSSFVILFFSQEHSDISVEEFALKSRNSANTTIDRSLVFPSEYYQAGVTALSNFGEVLRDKYPDINARVRIEQEGNIVRMHIDLPNGETDTVEETLEKYFLVVSKKQPAESLFDNPLKIAKLENKLDLIDAELRSTEKLYLMAIQNNEELKRNHNAAVTDFRNIIAEQSTQIKQLINLAAQQSAGHERVQLAQIGHSSTLFKDLLSEAQGHQVVLNALQSLRENLTSGIATVDTEEQIKAALATIQQDNPSLLARVAGQIEAAGYGVLAGPAFEWLKLHAQ